MRAIRSLRFWAFATGVLAALDVASVFLLFVTDPFDERVVILVAVAAYTGMAWCVSILFAFGALGKRASWLLLGAPFAFSYYLAIVYALATAF